MSIKRYNSVVEKMNLANNVIEVGPGCAYTTIQAAVDAAVAKGATLGDADTPSDVWMVLYGPDVDPTWATNRFTGLAETSTGADASGVVVMAMEDLLYTNSAAGMDAELRPRAVYTNYHDAPFVAVRMDDIPDGLVTAYAALTLEDKGTPTALHPIDYATYQGVPMSLATVLVSIGKSGHLTLPQVRRVANLRGHEIVSHSYLHGSDPANIAEMIRETKGSRDYLESLIDSEMPDSRYPKALGLSVKGWIQPGGYVNVANINKLSQARNMYARTIARYYQWSQAYMHRACPGVKHHGGGTGRPHYASTNAEWTAFVAAGPPQADTIIYGHNVLEDGSGGNISVANFKAVIDAIRAWADAGLVIPVTLSEFYSCVRTQPKRRIVVTDTDATGDTFTAVAHQLRVGDSVIFEGAGGGVTANAIYYVAAVTADTFQVEATRGGGAFNVDADNETNAVGTAPIGGGIPHGDFNDVTTLDGSQNWKGYNSAAIDATGGPDGSPCLKLPSGSYASIGESAYGRIGFVPGQQYRLHYRCRRDGAAEPRFRVGIYFYHEDTDGQQQPTIAVTNDDGALRFQDSAPQGPIVPYDAWTDRSSDWVQFTVPTWAYGVYFTFLAYAPEGTVWIDDVWISPKITGVA